MGSEIRLGQLIAPFGVGSIYTDKNGIPTVICGLDHWYKNYGEDGQYLERPIAVGANTIAEPRLSSLLKVSHFRNPPAYAADEKNPGLSRLKIPGHRFPRWYINNNSGQLRCFNLHTQRITADGRWKPVRFMAVCTAGHLSEFPWKAWAGCICNDSGSLFLNDSGGADLGSLTVRCESCQHKRSLAGATVIERQGPGHEVSETGLNKLGIACRGERPWLGPEGTEGHCDYPLAAVLINQSNVYFAKTISSIFLPDLGGGKAADIQHALAQDESKLVLAKVARQMNADQQCLTILKEVISPYVSEMPCENDILKAFDNYGKGQASVTPDRLPANADSELLAFRRAEFNILRRDVPEGSNAELRILGVDLPEGLAEYIARIKLVERLRETRAFYGFERLERGEDPLDDMPNRAMRQLFLERPEQHNTWLPAVKNYGEGIYIEIREDSINSWLDANEQWLERRYNNQFITRMASEPLLMPPLAHMNWRWAARYQLIHSLAHILINQLVFECGYSSAALKERLFVSSDENAPMAGILIYTASGDSEGSLGGVVRLGRPSLFEPLVKKALSRASWCSADPVCSENLGGAGARLINKAACHACILLPETSCETINNGLDRAAVVGVPDQLDVGFMSKLVPQRGL